MNFSVLLYEIRYQCSQLLFGVAGVFFLLLGIGFSRINLGGQGVFLNAPYSITFNLLLLSLLSVFLVTVLTAQTAMRDSDTGMSAILKSLPFPRWKQLLHAVSGLTIAILLLLLVSLAGMIIGTEWLASDTATKPLQISYYIIPFAVFIIPNTFLLVLLLFLAAQKTGSSLAVYLGGVGLYIGYFAIAILGDSPLIAGSDVPDPQALFWAGVVDPFGLTAFLEQTYHWSVGKMNTTTVRLQDSLLYNRLLWIGIGLWAGVLAIRGRERTSRSKARTAHSSDVTLNSQAKDYISATQRTGGWRYYISSALSQAKVQLSSLLKSKLFITAGILWTALVVLELSDSIGDGSLDTPYYALSELIVPSLFNPFTLFGSVIIIFFSSELLWMTRSTNIHFLIDATPVSDAANFIAVVFSTGLFICLLIILMILPAIGYQLLAGTAPDAFLYLFLFIYPGIPWLLTGVLTIGIQTFSPNKYLGMILTALIVIVWPPVFQNVVGIQTNLLQFAETPDLDYSIFAGFTPFLGSLGWHMFYWGLFCGIIGIIAVKGWKRGASEGIKKLLRNLKNNSLRPLIVCIILFFTSGGVIFVSETDNGQYITTLQQKQWQAAYERNFYKFTQHTLPSIYRVDLSVDLFPDERSYTVNGQYGVRNSSNQPIDSLIVGWNKTITNRQIDIGSIGPEKEYSPFNHFLFVFDESLQPGDSTRINFSMRVDRSSFADHDPNHAILSNGSFIRLERFIPWLGYNSDLELDDPGIRKQYGLPKNNREPKASSHFSHHNLKTDYNMTVSTSNGQQVAAPGTLTKSWKENGRNHFYFQSPAPMRMRYGIASARYHRDTIAVGDIAVHLLYHSTHNMNIPLLREASRSSLQILQELYGKYPRSSVTIVEIPSYHTGGIQATSYPGTIFIREHGGYTGDFRSLEEQEVNYLYRRIAHELAHQWWGDQLNMDRTAPGASVLTETMAEYSAAIILKRKFGEETYKELMKYDKNQYLKYRNRIGMETSLLDVAGENDYVAYFKGPIVLNAVAELIGEEGLLDILRDFMDESDDGVTARDFYSYLKYHVPENYHALLKQWFEDVENFNLKIDKTSVKQPDYKK